MSNNLFGDDDSDHTQIYPMPGGKREDILRMLQEEQKRQPVMPQETNYNTASSYATQAPSPQTASAQRALQTESNSLTDAATGLLVLIAHISNTLDARDTNQLKQQISEEIQHFSRQTKRLGIDNLTSSEATYILCTALDEAVLNTPWGRQSNWSKNTLLSIHFQDVRGGQIFFEKLRTLGEDPVRNLQVLKLMYYCLALGFQGRYRHENDAAGKLNGVRRWLGERLRSHANLDNTPDLSPHWRGITGLGFSLRDSIPAWLIGAVTAALLVGIYTIFFFTLSTPASDLISRMQGLGFKTAVATEKPAVPYQVPTSTPKLSVVLKDESKLIINDTDANHAEIRIQGETLFESGGVEVKESFNEALLRLATELNVRSGQIKVTGHTDNVVPTGRLKLKYADNKLLSLARAENVAAIIKQKLDDKTRVTIEGKGDATPLSPDSNNTKEGRAQNRRVTIDLLN